MHYLPHRIFMMSLQGVKKLAGRPLPTKEEAAASLRRLTGQDFGEDADAWAEWLKHHRKGLYKLTSNKTK
jgi:hypothetical protein